MIRFQIASWPIECLSFYRTFVRNSNVNLHKATQKENTKKNKFQHNKYVSKVLKLLQPDKKPRTKDDGQLLKEIEKSFTIWN